MPRYVRRLHTQRTLVQNKMAAVLFILISLFLHSKPEKYASYFLDCVNSKQQFNTELVKRLEFTMQYTFSPNIFVHVQIVDMSIVLIFFCYFFQKLPDEWIGKVNIFLNSKNDG